MNPDILAKSCMGGGTRIAAILVLEHIGLFLFFFTYTTLSGKNKLTAGRQLRSSYKRRRQYEDYWIQRSIDKKGIYG